MRQQEVKTRGWKKALFLFLKPYTSKDRWKRAFLGIDVGPPDPGTLPKMATLDEKSRDTLRAQLKDLHNGENERADAVRARSDQLLGRILAAVPLIGAVIGIALTYPPRGSWHASFVIAFLLLASAGLLLSLLLTLKNLGKEEYYSPLAPHDLLSDDPQELRPCDDAVLIPEYFRAVTENDLRNNDTIDRRHLAHSIFIVSVVFGAIGAVLVGTRWLRNKANRASSLESVVDAGPPGGSAVDAGLPAAPPARPIPAVIDPAQPD